jgi:hypothetical protein
VKLSQLVLLLQQYADGPLTLDELQRQLNPVLIADPLDVAASNAEPWDTEPADERLFWRLVYLFESEDEDGPQARAIARRLVASLNSTGSAETTLELLPVILDQVRLCTIVKKRDAGLISRTGLLSVVAESGYPEHVKLWLQHASLDALRRLCTQLQESDYAGVATSFSAPPA